MAPVLSLVYPPATSFRFMANPLVSVRPAEFTFALILAAVSQLVGLFPKISRMLLFQQPGPRL